MLKLNKNYMVDTFNQEWFNTLDKIHDGLLEWAEDKESESFKYIESDRQVGVTSMFISLILYYAISNRNSNVLYVTTNRTLRNTLQSCTKALFNICGIEQSGSRDIKLFNGSNIQFKTLSTELKAGRYDLIIFDGVDYMSYGPFKEFYYSLLNTKAIFQTSSNLEPFKALKDICKEEYIKENKIEIPFTIKGLEYSYKTIPLIQDHPEFKEQEYKLGCEILTELFKQFNSF